MSNNRPKLELQSNHPIKLKLLRDLPLVGENSHGKYTMYASICILHPRQNSVSSVLRPQTSPSLGEWKCTYRWAPLTTHSAVD
jgi:hypothetical protein